ncbi:MAG: rod shape-determining protein MreC [Candidatus Delongbacteria bacterium]|nr:rod shape-determining protein MreC [Candidatus Delongbacteria bacterium]
MSNNENTPHHYLLWIYLGLSLLFLYLNPLWQLKVAQIYLASVLAPVQKVVAVTEDFFRIRDENVRLREDVALLKLKLFDTFELMEENKRLKQLLRFQTENQSLFNQYRFVTARVIGVNPSLEYNSLLIDKGFLAGIRKNMPVINELGLVGKVLVSNPFNSMIVLLNDPNHHFSVVLERSRIKSTVRWKDNNLFELLDVSNFDEILLDDKVITSGLGGVYPFGIPFGKVVSADTSQTHDMRKSVLVSSFVNFSRIEDVIILLKNDEFTF